MNSLTAIQSKIYSEEAMLKKIIFWRFKDQKIVFTNGCFDLLHPGHIKVLASAAAYGDKLIVGLNTDASVKLLKGQHRPIMPENDRALMLASLQMVDAVILFGEGTPERIIQLITPDVLVKGGDYTVENIAGATWVLQHGGTVETVPLEAGYATSNIEAKIKQIR